MDIAVVRAAVCRADRRRVLQLNEGLVESRLSPGRPSTPGPPSSPSAPGSPAASFHLVIYSAALHTYERRQHLRAVHMSMFKVH